MDHLSEQERKDGYAEYGRFAAAARRAAATGSSVAPSSRRAPTARTIQPGGTAVTEGPYAESAEQVAGYFHIDTEDVDDLVECCRIIAAVGDAVQVVPTVVPESRPS